MRLLAGLGWCARHGRLALVAGLICGVALPGLAEMMRPAIAPLVVALLFLAVLRLGPAGVRVGLGGLGQALRLALVLQLALPLAAIGFCAALGVMAQPLAMGVALMLAAAPITGSPHIAWMVGADPAPALRQMVVGTALLPLTALPVFWLLPAFGSHMQVVISVARLLGLIGLAGGLALLLRHWRIVPGSAPVLAAIDGVATIALGLVVIGLMVAVGPALRAAEAGLFITLGLVTALNFGLQIAASLMVARHDPALAAPIGIIAGNRNIALFLGVLPAGLVSDLLLLIGCYQIPMYLTPLILRRWYHVPPRHPRPR